MNQSQLLAITCNLLEAREKQRVHGAIGFGLAITCNSLEAWEKSRVHGAIGFGLASHWLKN